MSVVAAIEIDTLGEESNTRRAGLRAPSVTGTSVSEIHPRTCCIDELVAGQKQPGKLAHTADH